MNNSVLIGIFFSLFRENTTLLASLDDERMSVLRNEYSSEFASDEVRNQFQHPTITASNFPGEVNSCTTVSRAITIANEHHTTLGKANPPPQQLHTAEEKVIKATYLQSTQWKKMHHRLHLG
jgi:hypothetical protein